MCSPRTCPGGSACDPSGRPLTLRLDQGQASFLLHWRDPAKVGHAGGLYQVIPVGIFQPSDEAAWTWDFSLWRGMVREFAEELCGHPEDYGPGPVDYDSWPFARGMAAAVDHGQIRVWCLGLGTDPLTYATDLLTVAVIDSRVFDDLFSLSPRRNAEGTVLGTGIRRRRHRPPRDQRAGASGRRGRPAAGLAASRGPHQLTEQGQR